MRRFLKTFPIFVLMLLTAAPSRSGENVAYEIYAKGYFVKNNAPLPGNPAVLVLKDKKAFDQIFGVGFVMGAKPKLVNEKLFETHLIVTVIKSGNTLWKYQIAKVHVDKKRLVVEYAAKGDESATAKFTVPLILSVPRGEYNDVVFIENGKEAGKQAVAGQEPIFAPGAKLKVEAEGDGGGEGPAWHPKLGVFTSGNDGHIHLLGPGGKSRIYRNNAGTNGLLFDADGNLLACEQEARRITRMDANGKITVLTDNYQGKRYNTPNDLTVDSKGRIYFSDPRYGKRDGMEILEADGKTIEGVYRIDPSPQDPRPKGQVSMKVTRVIGREIERPNGVLVSPDDRYLYVADNNNDTLGGARKLWRFDLKADGSVDPKSRKLIHDWGSGRGPDGLKQDREGRLYVAGGLNKPNPPFEPATDVKGGIYVFSPEGKLLTFLSVPRDEVTNCAFGGDDLKTLYITGGGTLYSIRTTTAGRVVWPAAK